MFEIQSLAACVVPDAREKGKIKKAHPISGVHIVAASQKWNSWPHYSRCGGVQRRKSNIGPGFEHGLFLGPGHYGFFLPQGM
jgi:hypothetical protein